MKSCFVQIHTIGRLCRALIAATVAFVMAGGLAEAQTKVRFQTDFVASGLYAGFFYAKEKGYYAAEKLDVELIDGKGSALTIEALAGGGPDIVDANSGVAALAIGQGREIVSVGMLIGKSTFGFFVPKSSGIDSIKALKGKSVVMTPGAPEASLLPAVFKLVGVDYEKDIQKIAVEASQKLSTYGRGGGDSMVTSAPFGNAIVQPLRPSNILPWTGVGFVLPDYSFLVKKSTLAAKPDIVAAFLRASYRGLAEAAAHPDEAIAAIAKERPLLNAGVAKQQWVEFVTYFCSDNMKGKPLGEHSPEDWSRGLKTLQEYAGLKGSLDADRFYTNAFFTSNNPVSKTVCGKGSYDPAVAVK